MGLRLQDLMVRQDRFLSLRLGVIVTLTTALLTAFFSYVFFELYGEAELCRQKYDLPPLSFYAERFDCFIAARDLAGKVVHIFALVAGPLCLASMTPLFVDWPRKGSGPSGQHLEATERSTRACADIVSRAQLWFWVMTAALGIALAGGLVLRATGLWAVSLNQVIGSVLIYAFHLYPAGILVFCAVETVAWLSSAFASRLFRPR
jgi:hypothetical protein